MKRIANIHLTFVLLLWCLAVLYLLGAGAFLFCWRYRGTPEEDGIGLGGVQAGRILIFFGWMERRTPEEGGISLGGDVVGDAFEVS